MSTRLLAGAFAAATALAIAGAPAIAAGQGPAAPSKPAATPNGSFALSGAEAAAFRLPAHLTKLRTWSDGDGNTLTRYQQVVGKASVIGGQVTTVTDASGTRTAVVGAYHDGISAKNTVRLSKSAATRKAKDNLAARQLSKAERQAAKELKTETTLRFDPKTRSYVYVVDTMSQGARPVRWVNASTGAVVKELDGLTEGEGHGVKGDLKTVDSTLRSDGSYVMTSADSRKQTYDFRNTTNSIVRAVDADDVWETRADKFASPDQRPRVDAHYYADVVDDFYGARSVATASTTRGCRSSPPSTSASTTATRSGTGSR